MEVHAEEQRSDCLSIFVPLFLEKCSQFIGFHTKSNDYTKLYIYNIYKEFREDSYTPTFLQ